MTGRAVGDVLQPSLDAPLPARVDVLVAGAGPAGALAAGVLAGGGRDVLMVDRAAFPRVKVCGEGLTPAARRILEPLGVWEDLAAVGCPRERARVFAPSGRAVIVPGPFLTIPRAELDTRLARWAVRRGAAFRRAAVRSVEPTAAGVRATLGDGGRERTVDARWVVLAVGAASSLAARLGLVEGTAQAVGLRAYLETEAPVPAELIGVFTRDLAPGYGWVFPLGEHRCNVGAVAWDNAAGRRGAPVSDRLRALAGHPAVRELFARGRLVGRPRAAQIRSGLRGVRAPAAGAVLAVGDALAAALPLTDEGIGKALASGRIAAEAILEAFRSGRDAASIHGERVARELAPVYPGFLAAERWATRARLLDLAAWCVERSPRLRAGLGRIVTDERDPRRVFSVRSVFDGLMRRR